MNQSRDISVTDTPCSCGYLVHGARDPDRPIKFDAQLNEYSFEYTLPAGMKISIMIYHCPMCGGVASESERGGLFSTVTADEVVRLNAVINNIETIEDINQSLGTADDDQTYYPPSDVLERQPRTGNVETGSIRVLTFTRLSKMADVQFRVYSSGQIERAIAPKQIGSQPAVTSSAPEREGPASRRSRRRAVRAETGDPRAQFELARALWVWGQRASEENKLEAMKWYRSAGKMGFVEAQLTLGGILLDSTERFYNPTEGIDWLRRAAERGDVGAQHLLAVQLAAGEIIERDPKRAAYWYRKAARAGDAAAEFNLGMMYWKGDGVPRSAATAREWVTKAARNGDMGAIDLLADAYETGELGFPIDIRNARYWHARKRRVSGKSARRRRK